MSNNKCPYCGTSITGGYCVSCSNISQKLYESLIRDIQELSEDYVYRTLWYDRAEKLKGLDKKLYHHVMTAARAYNKEIKERDKKIASMDHLDREIRRTFGTTALREMSFFEFCKAYDYTEREMAKKREKERWT